MKKIFVIDGTGFIFRSYYAIRQMTNHHGQSTNALYGFIRSFEKLKKDFDPKNLVMVFDGPNNKESRLSIYPDYKANRGDAPEDLPQQMQWAQQFCHIANIPMLCLPKVEADDTMGSVAKWAAQQNFEVYICSSDKDLFQLVSDNTFVLNTYKNNLIVDPKQVEQMFGVSPSQMIDYLSITGDSSDNIPGLPGFGPKAAASLLKEFGSLDTLLENADQVSGKKKQETLKTEAEKAHLSRKLVTLNTELPIPKEEEFYRLREPTFSALKEFYSKMDFSSLIKELKPSQDTTLHKQQNYQLVDSKDSFQQLITTLGQAQQICFDTETTSRHPMLAEIVGIGFCIEEEKAWYVPFNGNLDTKTLLASLKPLFQNPSIGFYGHNVKYDLHVLKNYDIFVHNICFDTILASYLLNSHSHRHSLDALSALYFDKEKTPIKSLIGSGKKEISMTEVPLDAVSNYCCEDVDYTCRLKNLLETQLRERKLEKLMYDLELPLMRILEHMERKGVYLKVELLQKMSEDLGVELAHLTSNIHELAGEAFNINSPKQLSSILFEKLKIPPSKKKTTGHSTSAAVLESLKKEYPIAEKVLEYRSLEKLRSTYVESLPNDVHPTTNRVHCSFNQFVAATGRLSCTNPNLQNIPVRSQVGRKIRQAFQAEKSTWSLLSADYSQIELRLLAHFSGDPNLLTAFQNNEDVHAFTASRVFSVPLGEVSKEMRNQAKVVNFGIIYGQQAYGLSKELNISIPQATQFIERYFSRYPYVRDFLESCKEQARKTGKATTLIGRERLIPDILSKNAPLRSAAERLAINTPLQGTAADLIKLAMLNVSKKIQEEQKIGYMTLQIHDELIFEIPDFEILDFEPIVRQAMENVFQLNVPLIVDISIGKNWKEC